MSKAKRQDYGEGSIYQRKSDGRWMATLEAGFTATGARRRVTVSAKTEAEVKKRLKRKKGEIAREGQVLGTSRKTVKAWADEWLEMTARTSRPKTHTTDKGAVRKWIVPTIGHRRLDELTPGDRRAVATAMRTADKPLPPSTQRRYDGVLVRMLKAAVEEGHTVPSRVIAMKPPKASPNDRQAMAFAHALAVLVQIANLPHGSRWVAALLQGMRQAECLGLTWPEVAWPTGDRPGSITISWQLQALPYVDVKRKALGFLVPDDYEARQLVGAWHLVRPKSSAGWRTIPMVPWMADALAAWQKVCPDSPHDLVWPAADGSPRNPRDDQDEWHALQEAAGVAHPSGRPYYPHEARHTTATLLMELGVAESVRILIMGHSSIQVTRGYETAEMRHALDGLTLLADKFQLGG